MNGHLGWMVVAATPKGTTGLPAHPHLINRLGPNQKGLPTFGGVWTDRADAYNALICIPKGLRAHFKVVPVGITLLEERP